MTSIRIVVIGAGPMGRLHARAIARRAARHGDCELIGIVDRNLTRSEEVASEFGGRAFESLQAVRADAAVVALLLVLLCMSMFAVCDRLLRGTSRAVA